ncbi:hypothetical protein BD309DRAFT_972318 [Dichomitus squalens]|uniref:Uncharacterized protein n=1 Tax=Dichomitus squalens TaxID=114155 RepID=A0A4V2K6L0_9APHY|nr:hypothetical protein BD309DRAFT_972318 [Dichomitus squalens]TBU52623.1 hypothetical protein BD310DRAFT_939844 [Dichomitus squalens]
MHHSTAKLIEASSELTARGRTLTAITSLRAFIRFSRMRCLAVGVCDEVDECTCPHAQRTKVSGIHKRS